MQRLVSSLIISGVTAFSVHVLGIPSNEQPQLAGQGLPQTQQGRYRQLSYYCPRKPSNLRNIVSDNICTEKRAILESSTLRWEDPWPPQMASLASSHPLRCHRALTHFTPTAFHSVRALLLRLLSETSTVRLRPIKKLSIMKRTMLRTKLTSTASSTRPATIQERAAWPAPSNFRTVPPNSRPSNLRVYLRCRNFCWWDLNWIRWTTGTNPRSVSNRAKVKSGLRKLLKTLNQVPIPSEVD